MTLAEMLTLLIERHGSDLHLVAGSKPTLRISGQLNPLSAGGVNASIERPLSELDNADLLGRSDVRTLFEPHLNERQMADIDARIDVNTSIAIDAHRFRACIFWDSNGLSASIRVIPKTIPTLEA